MDRKTCEQAVIAHGGHFVTKLSEGNFVVLGMNPGSKKTEEIDNETLTTMTEEEFFDRIGADWVEPPAKKAKKS